MWGKLKHHTAVPAITMYASFVEEEQQLKNGEGVDKTPTVSGISDQVSVAWSFFMVLWH